MSQITGAVRRIAQHEMNISSAIKEVFRVVADDLSPIHQEISRAIQQCSVLWLEYSANAKMKVVMDRVMELAKCG
jgi:hypothetical protein